MIRLGEAYGNRLYRVQRFTTHSRGKEDDCDKWFEGAVCLKNIDLLPVWVAA